MTSGFAVAAVVCTRIIFRSICDTLSPDGRGDWTPDRSEMSLSQTHQHVRGKQNYLQQMIQSHLFISFHLSLPLSTPLHLSTTSQRNSQTFLIICISPDPAWHI